MKSIIYLSLALSSSLFLSACTSSLTQPSSTQVPSQQQLIPSPSTQTPQAGSSGQISLPASDQELLKDLEQGQDFSLEDDFSQIETQLAE